MLLSVGRYSVLFASVLACTPLTTHEPTPPIPPHPPTAPGVVIAPAATGRNVPGGPKVSGPVVIFAAHGEGIAPIACTSDGTWFPGDTTQCTDLAKEGMAIHADTGAGALGAPGSFPCRGAGSPLDEPAFEGYAFSAPKAAEVEWALWPPEAKSLVAPAGDSIEATAAEIESIKGASVRGWGDAPVLAFDYWSGMLADLDGDGRADRVFSAHDPEQMIGVVAAFLAASPTQVTMLGNYPHFFPRLLRHTDLDSDGRREVWIFSAFVEGIEDDTVTSAFSEALYELGNGEDAILGSWGCRLF